MTQFQPRRLALLAVVLPLLGLLVLRGLGSSPDLQSVDTAPAFAQESAGFAAAVQSSSSEAVPHERSELTPVADSNAGDLLRVLVHDPHGVLDYPFALKVRSGKEILLLEWTRSGNELSARLPPSAGVPDAAVLELQGDFVAGAPTASVRFERQNPDRPEADPVWLARLDVENAVSLLNLTIHDGSTESGWRLAHRYSREGFPLLFEESGSHSITVRAPAKGYLELRHPGTWKGDLYRVRIPLSSAGAAREIKLPTGAVTVHVDQTLWTKSGQQKVSIEPEIRLGGSELRRVCECDAAGTVRFEHVPPGRYAITTHNLDAGMRFDSCTLLVDQGEEVVNLKPGTGSLQVAMETPAPEVVMAFAEDWARFPMFALPTNWSEGSSQAEFENLLQGSWRVLGFRQGARATGQAFVSAGGLTTLEPLTWRPSVLVKLNMHTAFEGHDPGRMEVMITDSEGFSYVESFVANKEVIFTYDGPLQLPPGPLRIEASHESGLIGEGLAVVPDLHEGVQTVEVWILFREP